MSAPDFCSSRKTPPISVIRQNVCSHLSRCASRSACVDGRLYCSGGTGRFWHASTGRSTILSLHLRSHLLKACDFCCAENSNLACRQKKRQISHWKPFDDLDYESECSQMEHL